MKKKTPPPLDNHTYTAAELISKRPSYPMAGNNKTTHVLVVPFPAQGHVMPLMKLSQLLVDHGRFKVTFVNFEYIHRRIVDSISPGYELGFDHGIRLVSVPDGLTPAQQKDVEELYNAVYNVFPGHLERLIENINESGESIACVIADETIAPALEVAEKKGIRRAAFSPPAALAKVLCHSIPTLIQKGIIDDNGFPKRLDETGLLSPTVPPIRTTQLVWYCLGNARTEQMVFESIRKNEKITTSADWLLCNSSYELEPSACLSMPNLLPIGPLLAGNQLGNLWPEDPTCLSWLDQQAPKSVIYLSFGSTTIFNEAQFHELALGLELLNRPFLWVIRPDCTSGALPNGFQDRVADRGKIVGWAPQHKLLSHTSVACFMSHCGWNSTVEGVSMGVPFICLPYFADQFINMSYIVDVWRVGLGLDKDENGIVTRLEIKRKVEQLIGDESLVARAQKLKEVTMETTGKNGSSFKNFEKFVNAVRSGHV